MTAATSHRGHASSTAQKKKKTHFSESNKDKKEKKYVTTNAIFKPKPDRNHKRAKASPESKRSGLGKSRLRREPSSSPPPRRFTLADESNEVLNSYRSHVTDDSEQMIAHAYKDLIQRLDRTTIGSDALSTRIADAIEASQDAFTPLADTLVTVNYKDDEGNFLRQDDVAIGGTVRRFEMTLQKKKDDLEALWEEWEHVRREIAETGAQILHDSNFPSEFGLEAVSSHLSPSSHTNPEVESLRRLIKKESEKAYKELDQEAKDAINKHKEFRDMWRSWLQDEVN